MGNLLDDLQPIENRDMVLCVLAWFIEDFDGEQVDIPLEDLNRIFDMMKAGHLTLYLATDRADRLSFKVRYDKQISTQI